MSIYWVFFWTIYCKNSLLTNCPIWALSSNLKYLRPHIMNIESWLNNLFKYEYILNNLGNFYISIKHVYIYSKIAPKKLQNWFSIFEILRTNSSTDFLSNSEIAGQADNYFIKYKQLLILCPFILLIFCPFSAPSLNGNNFWLGYSR